MLPTITKKDLELINDLSSRTFSGNSMSSNATGDERKLLKEVKNKLKEVAKEFKEKYDSDYGPFDYSATSGNPIAIGGTKLNRIWAGISKGAENKQYAAQISFVIDPIKPCLNVGFYFGRASARSLNVELRKKLENNLKKLGEILSNEIKENEELNLRYNSLFDYGFRAIFKDERAEPKLWLDFISGEPKNSQIITQIYPNDEGYIDFKTIDLYVSMVICLMAPIPLSVNDFQIKDQKLRNYKPFTAEQRAKKAERRTLIGEKGEIIVFNYEKERLNKLGLLNEKFPKHVALELRYHDYDVLSCNEKGEEIYIEVKSTTRTKEDPESQKFHMTSNEYNYFLKNPTKYFLYRVYDVENNPQVEIVNMKSVKINPNVFLIEIVNNEN